MEDFDSFFIANYPALAKTLYRIVGDTHAAEELASEAFWKLHTRPPSSRENLIGCSSRSENANAATGMSRRRFAQTAMRSTPWKLWNNVSGRCACERR